MKYKLLALAVGVIAMALPVALAFQLARKQALDQETRQLSAMARDVLRRADETSDQSAAAIERLLKAGDAPCSPASIAVRISVRSG